MGFNDWDVNGDLPSGKLTKTHKSYGTSPSWIGKSVGSYVRIPSV